MSTRFQSSVQSGKLTLMAMSGANQQQLLATATNKIAAAREYLQRAIAKICDTTSQPWLGHVDSSSGGYDVWVTSTSP